jgi:hypothetical protein
MSSIFCWYVCENRNRAIDIHQVEPVQTPMWRIYIHFQDKIYTDGNANNVSQMTILPATYNASP